MPQMSPGKTPKSQKSLNKIAMEGPEISKVAEKTGVSGMFVFDYFYVCLAHAKSTEKSAKSARLAKGAVLAPCGDRWGGPQQRGGPGTDLG